MNTRGTLTQSYSIPKHDAKIFFGDLNFRIDHTSEQVVAWVEQKNYQMLMKRDDLFVNGPSHPLLKHY